MFELLYKNLNSINHAGVRCQLKSSGNQNAPLDFTHRKPDKSPALADKTRSISHSCNLRQLQQTKTSRYSGTHAKLARFAHNIGT